MLGIWGIPGVGCMPGVGGIPPLDEMPVEWGMLGGSADWGARVLLFGVITGVGGIPGV